MKQESGLCRRFTAVTRPISYARQKTSRRVYVMIAAPWIVSLAISSPIALGLNRTPRRADTPRLCTFYNSDFLIYSSMGSFYVPTVVMIVLYWRVYLAIRSRRCASTSSGRSQQMRPADESISCMASAAHPQPSTIGEAARGVTGGDQASHSDATLSAVAATLSTVQRRGKELALRVAATNAANATVVMPEESLPAGDNRCRTPLPTIAVVDTADVAIASPLTISDGSIGTVPQTPAELTPTSVSTAVVEACGLDCAAPDSGCTDTMPEMTSSGWNVVESKNAALTQTQKPSDAEQDANDSAARCLVTLSVPTAVSGLCSRRAVVDAGAETSTCFNSDEDDGETVMRVETPPAIAPVADRVNGRFVTFFNFASKERTATSNATDRRFKRAVRRERRATKTLAIVLGNLSITSYESYETRTHSVFIG